MYKSRLHFDFFFFYQIVVNGNVTGKTNPEILRVLSDYDLPEDECAGSTCSYIVNGRRPLQRCVLSKLKSLSLEHLAEIFIKLDIQNSIKSINVIYSILKYESILILDSSVKKEVMDQLIRLSDPIMGLALLYRYAICGIHKNLSAEESELAKNELSDLISKYENTQYLLANYENTSYISKNSLVDSVNSQKQNLQMLTASVKGINYQKLFDETAVALCSYINTQEIGLGNYYCGWCRNIEQPGKTGVWATADGLCIAALSYCRESIYRKNRQYIIEGLWTRRYPNGGFSNENQRFPSIETTCNVIEAFNEEREYDKAFASYKDLVNLWRLHRDKAYVGGISVVYLSQMLCIFCDMKAEDELLDDIEQEILKAACTDESGRIFYWNPPIVGKAQGSAVHTAMAIRALMCSASYRNQKEQMEELLRDCADWLSKVPWDNTSEITYRSLKQEDGSILTDETLYEHYATPWCIMALLKMNYSREYPRILEEIHRMVSSQENGLWYHNHNSFPQIWVTHDVLRCIHEYAFS